MCDGETQGYDALAKTFKVSCVLALMGCCAVGNGTMLSSLQHHPPSVARQLTTSLALFSLVHGTVTGVNYAVTVLTGAWLFGHWICQLYGILSLVLAGGWVWMLLIAAAERYYRIVVAQEHASLFSSTNTKLMVWGCNLLLVLIVIGPTYGWGEFSHRRGELALLVHVKNGTGESEYFYEADTDPHMDFINFLSNPIFVHESAEFVTNISSFFTHEKGIHVRGVRLIHEGLLFSIRPSTVTQLTCLWKDMNKGSLDIDITQYLDPSNNLPGFALSVAEFGVYIDVQEYARYRDGLMFYQDSATCGLDFSHVNTNIESFITFVLCAVLGAPLLGFIYFIGRTCYSLCCTTDSLEPAESTHGVQNFIVIVITVCLTYMLLILHFAINILGGRGESISAPWHVFCNLCFIAVSFTLSFVHALVHKLPSLMQCVHVSGATCMSCDWLCIGSCDVRHRDVRGATSNARPKRSFKRSRSESVEYKESEIRPSDTLTTML